MRALVLPLLLALLPAVASAQSDSAAAAVPKPGAEIRITTRAGRTLYGRLDTATAGALRVRVPNAAGVLIAVPRDSIARVEVNHAGGRRVLAGGLLGFAAGTVVGSAIAGANCVVFCTPQQVHDNSKTVAVAMLAGTGLGLLTGAAQRSAHWQEVPVDRIGVTVQAGGGVGLGLTLRF